MAVASWMLRGRNLSHGRSFRSRSDTDEDAIQMDVTKDVNENIYEILTNICQRHGIPANKKLAFLNFFIKVLDKATLEKKQINMRREDLLFCLRIGLVNEDTTVRAATLRAIRHFITDVNDVLLLNKLNITTLITRSVDIVLKNEIERVEAFRLSQRILKISPKHFPKSIVRAMVSIANNDCNIKDRMTMVTLTLLCQLCILNPDVVVECDGHVALLRNSVVVGLARVNECIMGSLLYLLNNNLTRLKSNITLDYLNSVYCDVYSKKDERGDKFEGSLLSMLAVLRSFTGVLYLCQSTNTHTSVIRNIIDMLSVEDANVREGVLFLLYEIFGLNRDNWSSQVPSAVDIIDPIKFQDQWRLSEGFMVAEGKALLPSLIVNRCNLRQVHLTLILYCLLDCGLLNGLVHVIVSCDPILALHSTVLLGYVLHLCHTLLPPELIDLTPALPSLLAYIADGEPGQRQQALKAVSILNRIHEMFKKRPAAHSLYLKQIIDNGDWWKYEQRNWLKYKTNMLLVKDIDYVITTSQVLSGREYARWDWNVISSSLRCGNESLRKLEDGNVRMYVRRLVEFYKPSSRKFSNISVTTSKIEDVYVLPLLSLVDLLLSSDEGEVLLTELMTEISTELRVKCTDDPSAHNTSSSLLHDQHTLENTACQYYILTIGHLTKTNRGVRLLMKLNLMEYLMDMVSNVSTGVTHMVLMSRLKLLLSSLCYNNCPIARTVLSKALTSPNESARIYSTELLLVLARGNSTNFNKWGVELLVSQLYDESQRVADLAVSIAHELCYDNNILESVIRLKPSLLHLGDKGNLLLIRFLSTPSGFTFLNDANFIKNELEKWDKHFNYRYVGLLEDNLHDALTLHRRGDDNKYLKRLTNVKHKWRDVFVLPHLYGELVQHQLGAELIFKHGHLHEMIQTVATGTYLNKGEVLEMKACLWAVSHVGTSESGVNFLEKENLFQYVVELASGCPVLPVRATAFYCLNLMSSVPCVGSILARYGWYCTQHDRYTKWPLLSTLFVPQADDAESVSDTSVVAGGGDGDATPQGSPKCEPASNKSFTLPPGFNPGRSLHRRTLSESQHTTRRRRTMSENYDQARSESGRGGGTGVSPGAGCCGHNLSFQDALGLATLQSLHSNRRPEMTSRTPELEEFEFRRRFSSIHDRSGCSLMCEFEAQYPPRLFSNGSQSSLLTRQQQTSLQPDDHVIGDYMGICLPKQLTTLLTVDDKMSSVDVTDFTEVDDEDSDCCTNSVCSTSTQEEENDDKEEKSASKTQNRRRGHDTVQCIICCSRQRHKRQRHPSNSSCRLRTETESSHGNTDSSPVTLKWRLRTQSESVFGSGEHLQSSDDQPPKYMTTLSSVAVGDNCRARRAVIKHVTRMCNPVWSRTSKQALLELKQGNANVYQDVCLYSDLCNILTTSSCKVGSRRLIQELFLDLSYEQLYEEALLCLKQYEPVQETTPEVTSPVLSLNVLNGNNGANNEELKTLYENSPLN